MNYLIKKITTATNQILFFIVDAVYYIKNKNPDETTLLEIDDLKVEEGKDGKWDGFEADILKKFKTQKNNKNFLRFKGYGELVHPNQQKLALKIYKKLKGTDLIKKEKISIDKFGKPQRFWLNPDTSPQRIIHLYNIFVFRSLLESITKKSPPTEGKINYITEFGAGFGGSTISLHSNFANAKIKRIDLPVMLKIQDWYFENTNQKHLIENSHEREGISLFWATWSLSECALTIRQRYEELIERHDIVFITFQRDWFEIENLKYFKLLSKRLKKTHIVEIKELPEYPGNYALIAMRPQ